MSATKIAVVGAGAMGSVYAAHFREAGCAVVAVDVWDAHVDAIARDGLRLEGPAGDRVVSGVAATTDPSAVAGADLVVIATKAAGAEAAAAAVAPYLGPGALTLAMQNGLGAGDLVAAVAPPERTLLGVAQGFGASMVGPGRARHAAMARVMIGARPPTPHAAAERVAALWRAAGFNASAVADVQTLLWEKFIFNVAFSAPCALFGRTVGGVLDDPATRWFAFAAAAEAERAGRAQGVALSFDALEPYILGFAEKLRAATPSLAQDHAARRRSEIDFLNGRAPVEAAKVGLAAPVNDALAEAIRAREATF